MLEGNGVVASARKIIGKTNPLDAEPGTIRGDFGIVVGRNIVHGSDSVENGERETGEYIPDLRNSWFLKQYIKINNYIKLSSVKRHLSVLFVKWEFYTFYTFI